MGLPPFIPGFVAIGVVVSAAIMLGLWGNDGVLKGAFNGGLLNCNSGTSSTRAAVCAFLSSYPIAMAGGGLAIIGGFLGILSGFVGKGENGHLRISTFMILLFASIFSLGCFGVFLGSFPFIFNGISLNIYGQVML